MGRRCERERAHERSGRMEKERRLNTSTRDAPTGEPLIEPIASEEDLSARIAALQEEKQRYVNSATEADIRDILAQPIKSVEKPPKKECCSSGRSDLRPQVTSLGG